MGMATSSEQVVDQAARAGVDSTLSKLAQGRVRHGRGLGRQWRRELVDRMAVLALLLGDVKRVVGGGDQPVRERADLARPLRDANRDRERDILSNTGGGIVTAHLDDPARDRRTFAQR